MVILGSSAWTSGLLVTVPGWVLGKWVIWGLRSNPFRISLDNVPVSLLLWTLVSDINNRFLRCLSTTKRHIIQIKKLFLSWILLLLHVGSAPCFYISVVGTVKYSFAYAPANSWHRREVILTILKNLVTVLVENSWVNSLLLRTGTPRWKLSVKQQIIWLLLFLMPWILGHPEVFIECLRDGSSSSGHLHIALLQTDARLTRLSAFLFNLGRLFRSFGLLENNVVVVESVCIFIAFNGSFDVDCNAFFEEVLVGDHGFRWHHFFLVWRARRLISFWGLRL